MSERQPTNHACRGVTRRSFLADTGMGFTGLALSAMLFDEDPAKANSTPSGIPQSPPKARSVIWIFLCGGDSNNESCYIKPQ